MASQEEVLVHNLANAASALGLPPAVDLRNELPRHPTKTTWRTRDIYALKGLVWHQELGWGTVEQVAAYHTSEQSHLDAGGVESISYTWAIRRNGQIVLCNDLSAKTWSQGDKSRPGDENAEFMAVMMEGLFNGQHVTIAGDDSEEVPEPTQEQLLAALILWRVCQQDWKWDWDALYGHYHFGKAACPGYTASAVIEAFRVCPLFGVYADEVKYNLDDASGRQEALIRLGYLQGEADGIWGPMSKGALVKFQNANGLVADGVWGARTEAAMVARLEEG